MSRLLTGMIAELNERSREVFRLIVEAYCETGDPVGSRTVSRQLAQALSPATVRNVMADLEDAGLLFAPHTSAGADADRCGPAIIRRWYLRSG